MTIFEAHGNFINVKDNTKHQISGNIKFTNIRRGHTFQFCDCVLGEVPIDFFVKKRRT